MRIGIAQINTIAGTFAQTVERMLAQSQRAAEQGVDLLVFPLAALAGVQAVPYADRISFMRDVADAIADLSDRLACPAIVPVPLDLGDEEGYYDALLLEGGAVRPLRMSGQNATPAEAAAPGQGVPAFSFAGLRFALALSHADLDELGSHGCEADAVLFVSGYPFAMDDPSSAMGADLDNARFASDARDMGAWLVGVSSVGGYGEEVFPGSSFVLAPSGELVASAPAFEESLLVAQIESPAPERLADPVFPDVFDAPFHLWQAIALGIHDYAAKHGMTEVALCLDGTMGASVLAALASDAMGPLHVHALIGASAGAHAPACRELARRLRIDEADATGHPRSLDARDLDELELAALARDHHALVLSSLDKTALSLGVPRSGVSAAQLCPLGDVYRSDVLDMAHVRNTISPLFRRVDFGETDALVLRMADGSERVIASEQEIIHVDEILLGYIEYDRPFADLVESGAGERDLVEAVLRAQRVAEPWRRACPPVLAMSTRTLDDARFPLGTRWHDEHLDSLDAAFVRGLAGEPQTSEEPSTAPASEVDLDATLAMLRDIIEQGGFAPADLAPLAEMGPLNAGPGDGAAAPGPLGWMTPFSEN